MGASCPENPHLQVAVLLIMILLCLQEQINYVQSPKRFFVLTFLLHLKWRTDWRPHGHLISPICKEHFVP